MKPWMFIALLLVLAAPQHYRSDFHTANESARIYTAQAIVHHGTVSMNPVFVDYQPQWKPTDRPFNVDVSKRNGDYLLDKAPGITLLALPVVAVHSLLSGGKSDYASLAWLLTFLLCALPCALFARFMARWLGEGDTWSVFVPIALLLATPWLAYAGLLFGHALAAVFVGLGAMLALGPLKEGEEECCARAPLWGGLSLGAAVLTEYTTALYVILVCGVLLCTPERRKRLIPVILGGMAPALILLAWNSIVFGGPFSFSYSFKDHPDHAEIIAQGAFGFSWPNAERLAGIIFSAKRGLLFLAPWLLTSFIGTIWAVRDTSLSRVWRVFLPLVVLGIPILVSGFVDWEAGDSMGPRHLVPALPIFGIASFIAFRRLTGSIWITVLAGLIGASFLMCFLGAFVFPYFPGTARGTVLNPVFELSVPLILLGNTGHSIFDSLVPNGLTFVTMMLLGSLVLAKSGGFLNRLAPVPLSRIGIATLMGVFYLFLAIAPVTPGENARVQVSHAQAFAHDYLERSDLSLRIYETCCINGDAGSCVKAARLLRDERIMTPEPERAKALLRKAQELRRKH
jgi:hypothetical protein